MESKAIRTDYTTQITALIRSNDSPKAMMQHLEDYHANDIADAIETLAETERRRFFRICAPDMLAEVFEYAEENAAGSYLGEMDIRISR